ncbi:melanopsin-like [Asterias amurensis]|uniref:melanopsin-like n=1 Tax=Asterias amurensis TaxID=7602 RepID=UPI003AB190D2
MAENTTAFVSTLGGVNQDELCHSDNRPAQVQVLLEIIFLVIVSLAGTFGNLLVIIAVASTRSLRTVANYFIFVLAAVDFVNTGLLIPLFIFTLMKGEWPFPSAGCTLLGYLTIICIATSEITLSVLAGTRYLIVTKSKTVFNRYFKKKYVIFYLVGIAAFELSIILIPLWTSLGKVGFSHRVLHCTFVFCNQTEWWYVFILFVCCMIINMGIIPTFYLLTFHAVSKSKRTIKALQAMQGTNERSQPSMSPQEVQLTKKLLFMFLVFIVCWFPYCIVIFADSQQTVSPLVHQITNLPIWLASCLNPYIYAFRIRNFRKAFKQILTWPGKKCRSQEGRARGGSVTDQFGTSMADR